MGVRSRRPPKAVIVGGSVGGLYAANLLLQRGWDIDVFERVSENLATRGAGIARHWEMKDILAAAGVAEETTARMLVDGRTAYDRFGRQIDHYPYPQHLAAWSSVFNPLFAAFPSEHYHAGMSLTRISQAGDKAVAQFADGSSIEADLIIGADGFRSTVRSLCAPEIVPRYGGYVAWRGIVDENLLSESFKREAFGQFSFCFPLRSQFIGYPVGSEDHSVEPGRRRYTFLWYYPVDDGDEITSVLTDDSGYTHEFSIPPPLIRKVHIAKLKRNAVELLPPRFAEVVERTLQHMVQPIYDVKSERVSFGRIALLGDAAFVARPHVGVGVLKSWQDGFALASCLEQESSVPEALARYDQLRVPKGHAAVDLGRYLGDFIERRLPGPEGDPAQHLSPQKIIRISARPVEQVGDYRRQDYLQSVAGQSGEQANASAIHRAPIPDNSGGPAMDGPDAKISKAVPFDAAHLDSLMDEADLDVLLVTSKHNVQYLLGGYRFFFFEHIDAIGVSRYLPIFIYQKGKPEKAAYFANALEKYEKELDRFWTPTAETASWTTVDAMRRAVEYIRRLGEPMRRIGVESAFLPSDAEAVLRQGIGNAEIVDCFLPLERLRARKTPHELELLRKASERVVDAMIATFEGCAPGLTKNDLVRAMKREETGRDLSFEYCLVTAGASLNRAPSDQRLQAGDIISLDSGGNYHGYIGDLCRMGILGEPDAELQDLIGVVEEIQQAARKPIKAGARGGDIYVAARELINASPHRAQLDFAAHGMGLVSHEAPRLTSHGPVPYAGYDEDRSLESGMVISIETALLHPRRGFIKLEDTVAVTATGCEGYGDGGRGWNRAGTRP